MREHVTITIDGEDLVLMGGAHPAQYPLEVAGVHPSRYDLLRIDADGKHVVTHHPGDTVVLADGDDFITARISTTTA